MASWVALNVEPDDGVEDEVDDTKELQIEEALKLYQNALKLHSQGPEYYAQAAEAYDSLLDSEIFKYPESISEFQRAVQPDTAQIGEPEEIVTDTIGEFNVNDSTSSLFQTLYLSHKNYGKYLLDSAQETLRTATPDADTASKRIKVTKKALGSFAEALERDDTDLNLWRQSARLSGALDSYRLSRFCLESVLADDDNRLEVRSEQLGLEEIFSEERLRATLGSVFDELSAYQVPAKKPKKALVKYLKRHEDTYPYLPNLPDNLHDLNPKKGPLALALSRREINPPEATWESVGKTIIQAIDEENQASAADAPSRPLQISLPSRESQSPNVQMEDADDAPERETTEQTKEVKPEPDDASMAQEDKLNLELEKSPANTPAALSEPAEEQSSIDQSAEKQLMESLEGQSTKPHEPQITQEDTNIDDVETISPTEARKRSSASAANDDQPEGGRMKSRRTRARESNAEALVQPEEIAFDQERYYGDRLEIFVNADEWVFNTVDPLFSKVGINALGSIDILKEKVAVANNVDTVSEDSETRLFQDIRGIIKSWNDQKSRLMQQKDDTSSLKDMRGSSKSGLAVFLEHTRKASRKPLQQEELPSGEKLYTFSNNINDRWLHPHDTSFEWLKQLLMPNFGEQPIEYTPMKSAYACFVWSDDLKATVADLLLREDEFIFSRLSELIEVLGRRILESSDEAAFEYYPEDFAELEMIQSIYELHLDIFSSVENLSDANNQSKRLAQRDRLSRWGMLARTALDYFIDNCPLDECRQNISLRHIWTSTFHLNLAGEADREHILLCLQDLKQILQSIEGQTINMLNNSIMSELSVATIDQEVLKLKCMDFFAKVFNADGEDPVSLIEAIEPILEPSSVEDAESTSDEQSSTEHPSHSSEMASFLDRGDATLRLFLWRRLLEAYQGIDYPPKVVSCYLRSVEIIMTELEDAKHIGETDSHRQVTLLGWLKSLDSIMGKAIPLILTQTENAFECVDMDHLQASMSAVARLTRILHSFILYEDSVRVGQISGRDLRGALAKSLESFKERMRELYVRCWILLYSLFVDAISQNKELFDDPFEDRIHILRSLHNALGIRSMCRYSQKRFLKLMKAELFSLETKGDYELDVCQILYDLHGIKFSPLDGTADHGCSPEKLDRLTATMMIDFVLRQANKMNMKDLSKSELKTTIEKMQQAIGSAKLSSQSPAIHFNRRVFSAYIKAPINPSHLLRAVQGVTELSMLSVTGENAKIAAKGWYFLLGHATLTKFRAQKRLTPGSTAELDDAINFFRQDLDHGTGRWETFYRLAQTYDTKLEEDTTWTADKINNNRNDLATTQRYAIHCYAMAVSTAIRTGEATAESRALVSDLHTDFAIRLYSSSREPLSMGAFSLVDFPRHFSSQESQQMYKGQPFREMPQYSVWFFASNLLRRAIVDKPKRWMNHYFLGKCLWKMYCTDDSKRTTSKRVEVQDVLDAFHDAISALPRRKDSRADPIFEPHFKLFSIVNRLVSRGDLTPAEGVEALGSTPWAAKVDPPESLEGWKPYALEVIKKFKSADKSNWHHRMSAKAAHIIYDDEMNATTAAAAKHEMSQIFTKTLTIQVWRPEYERPGRHFVYTTRYVYFFVSLLDQLDDRSSLDQLLRRVRKKQGDFINHTKLWEDACLVYAKMIRRAAHINEGHEESVFRPLGWEEFSSKTARLEGLSNLSAESLPLLDLIRDSLELKKLNNSLMKVTMFEDLVADLYSRLYELNIPLLNEQVTEENKEKMKVDHLLMTGDATAETSAASLPASDTPAPRGRTKGIARRDIQKRADTIVNLKLGPRTTAKFATTETETATPARRGSNVAEASGLISTTQEHKSTSTGVEKTEEKEGANSGDESDLSDVDESKLDKTSSEQKSLKFPNLNGELGENETEDDVGSGEDNAEEGEGEGEDDEGANENNGEDEEDVGAEEGQDGEEADDDDDARDGEGEGAVLLEEDKPEDEDENDDERTEQGDEEPGRAEEVDAKDSNAPTPSESTEKPDAMDITPV